MSSVDKKIVHTTDCSEAMAERAKQQQQQRRSSEDALMQQSQAQQAQHFVPQQVQHQYEQSNQQQMQHQTAHQAQHIAQQHVQQQTPQHKVPQQAMSNVEVNGHGNGQSTPPTPAIMNSMSEAQIAMLKNQIMAFKLLNKNLPIRKNFHNLLMVLR